MTGALSAPAQVVPDTRPPGPGACPTRACDPALATNGFDLDVKVIEGEEDGIVVAGEAIALSAAATTNPGGCVGGNVQFRFSRDGQVVQDWSADATFTDHPSADAAYLVQARCDREPDCTTDAANPAGSRTITIYPGDGTDIVLTLAHDRPSGTTMISWPSRPQVPAVSGYDLYRGTIMTIGDPNLFSLAGLWCLSGDIPQPAGAPGPPLSVVDAASPPAGQAFFYLAGHCPVAADARAALGRRSDGSLRPQPPACP